MSTTTPAADSVYIHRLQVIPPSLFFLVPLAAIILFFLSVSDTGLHHRHDPALKHIHRPSKRVAWVFPVIFSLAVLAIVCGALLFFRGASSSFALVVADSVVSSVLYLELSISALYLLAVVVHLSNSIRPIVFYVYGILLGLILTSATLISILGSFKTMPPLLAPILHLVMAVITMPLITFGLLSALNASEASSTPPINLLSTYSEAFSSEKPRTLDVVSSGLDTQTALVESNATRNVSLYVLCGQISAIVHFAFAIGILVLLPGQSSASTFTSQEMVTGVWVEALVFRTVQTAFLVFWIICTMFALLQLLYYRVNRPLSRFSAVSASLETTAFTDLPPRALHHVKSLSSSFSSPRPRRRPIRPEHPTPNIHDFLSLNDPFASPKNIHDAYADDPADPSKRPTRMSAWGTLPPIIPPRPPPNVLVINPQTRPLPSLPTQRLPGARSAASVPSAVDSGVYVGSEHRQRPRSMSMFSYTTPSAYSQDMDPDEGDVTAFDVEEAMLAQKLLRRLDSGVGWIGSVGTKLGRSLSGHRGHGGGQ
ncbi:hypothetical protein C8J57DRAFT_55059 [Mycena rebaudengoi]|nr:hypothetical protein C8J57DRAFT_55059 [Mycena rebaudengoi]